MIDSEKILNELIEIMPEDIRPNAEEKLKVKEVIEIFSKEFDNEIIKVCKQNNLILPL
jgi:hypothetical protein